MTNGNVKLADGVAWVAMRPCIVIADDNESLRFLTRIAVEEVPGASDVAVEEADDGLAAFGCIERLVSEGNRILLLSDNRMPRMTGIELARALRARFEPAQVSIEVLTSAAPPTEFVRAFADVQARVHERPGDLKGLRQLVAGIIADWQAPQPSPGAL